MELVVLTNTDIVLVLWIFRVQYALMLYWNPRKRNRVKQRYMNGRSRLRRGEGMEWILTSDRLPEDLEQVLITYTNTRPEPYYKDILGKNFTGAGYYYDGHWYWWSDVTDDLLKEYGRMPFNPYLMDEAIKVLAWQPFPKPLER